MRTPSISYIYYCRFFKPYLFWNVRESNHVNAFFFFGKVHLTSSNYHLSDNLPPKLSIMTMYPQC
jgi:hypothetical protein